MRTLTFVAVFVTFLAFSQGGSKNKCNKLAKKFEGCLAKGYQPKKLKNCVPGEGSLKVKAKTCVKVERKLAKKCPDYACEKIDVEACKPGSYKADGGCRSCGQNTYSVVPDAAACTDCPSGRFAASGSSSARDCNAAGMRYSLPNALKVGDKFSFSGVYDSSAPRFGFNVENAAGDYLFRVAFRPPGDPAGGNNVVMNSRKSSKWDVELRAPPAPLKNGEKFLVTVICEEKAFVVYLNSAPLEKVQFTYRYGLGEAAYFSLWGGAGKIAFKEVAGLDGKVIPA